MAAAVKATVVKAPALKAPVPGAPFAKAPFIKAPLIKAPFIKAPKARSAAECHRLEQLPNIGPSLAGDLRLIGIHAPQELVGEDAHALYQRLCAATGQRQDPCVLDTFMAATDFMRGAPPAPWWHYTPQRKAQFGSL